MCGECITARDGNEDKLRQAAAATTEQESADVMFGMHEDDIILAVRSNNTVDYFNGTRLCDCSHELWTKDTFKNSVITDSSVQSCHFVSKKWRAPT